MNRVNMALHQARRSRAVQVRHVFEHNLGHEFAVIMQVANSYRYVTIDTEFPGLLYQTTTHPRDLAPEQRYSLVKANVDNLKLIQLGLTFSNRDGDDAITWEFNFRGFNPMTDSHAPTSVELLKSQGIDFCKNYTQGVDPDRFAFLFWSSGLPCNPNKIWITFHGAYDIAYLMKLISRQRLPDHMHMFFYFVTAYFGRDVFDVKHLIKSCNGLYGGLENVAKILKVERVIGRAHNAGSDSLLTWAVYNQMLKIFFKGGIEARHAQILCGMQEL